MKKIDHNSDYYYLCLVDAKIIGDWEEKIFKVMFKKRNEAWKNLKSYKKKQDAKIRYLKELKRREKIWKNFNEKK